VDTEAISSSNWDFLLPTALELIRPVGAAAFFVELAETAEGGASLPAVMIFWILDDAATAAARFGRPLQFDKSGSGALLFSEF
jgi:hypothetical protein